MMPNDHETSFFQAPDPAQLPIHYFASQHAAASDSNHQSPEQHTEPKLSKPTEIATPIAQWTARLTRASKI